MSDARVGVACVVLRDHGEAPVLLLRRAFGDFDGEWCFIAGSPKAGEPLDAAVRRELREETGLAPSRLEPLAVSHHVPDLELHVFVARVEAHGSLHLDSEHSEYRWSSFDDAARSMPLEGQREMLRLARTHAARDANAGTHREE